MSDWKTEPWGEYVLPGSTDRNVRRSELRNRLGLLVCGMIGNSLSDDYIAATLRQYASELDSISAEAKKAFEVTLK